MKSKTEDEPLVEITLDAPPELVAAINETRRLCAALNLDADRMIADLLAIGTHRLRGTMALRGYVKGDPQQ
jgi:hypothetical protein